MPVEAAIDILIIDDELDTCILITALLLEKGFRAEYVNSIGAARKLLQQKKAAVMIVDNHLPDGKGIDFVSYARLSDPSVRIIMISAYDDALDKQVAYAKGIDNFLSKPIDIEEIYKVLSV